MARFAALAALLLLLACSGLLAVNARSLQEDEEPLPLTTPRSAKRTPKPIVEEDKPISTSARRTPRPPAQPRNMKSKKIQLERECKPLAFRFRLLGDLEFVTEDVFVEAVQNMTGVELELRSDIAYSTRTVFALRNYNLPEVDTVGLANMFGLLVDSALGNDLVARESSRVMSVVEPRPLESKSAAPSRAVLVDVDMASTNGSHWAPASSLQADIADLDWQDLMSAADVMRTPAAMGVPRALARYAENNFIQIARDPVVQASIEVLIPNDCETEPAQIRELLQELITNGTLAARLSEDAGGKVSALLHRDGLAANGTLPAMPVLPEAAASPAEGPSVSPQELVPELTGDNGEFEAPEEMELVVRPPENETATFDDSAAVRVGGVAAALLAAAATTLLAL